MFRRSLHGLTFLRKSPAELELRDDLMAQRAQRFLLLIVEPAGDVVDHRDRSERHASMGDDRRARIEADLGPAGDELVAREPRVLGRVADLEHVALQDRVCAERQLAPRLQRLERVSRLEPLPLFVDQRDQRRRRSADQRGQSRELVECQFGGRVEDLVLL